MDPKALGTQLRKYRRSNNLSLEALAKTIDCSKSYLSQIENGLSSPSLTILGALARNLGINVADLFKKEVVPAKTNWHLRVEDRRTLQYPSGLISSQPLTTEIFQKKMQPIITTVEAGGSSSNGNQLQLQHSPGSEEFVLVLKGIIEFIINGEKIILKEGDTLYFDGNLPHQWTNRTEETAQLLFVFTPAVW